ncbi:MAG: ParB N-terminal domain-containing protein [Bacteroidota bacterium]
MEKTIKSTKDYSIFKKLEGNRSLISTHISCLIQSIKKENLLHIRPILVNEDMEVIDGQHRLEAATSLDTEIYYVQMKDLGPTQVATLNSNQKNWKLLDYLNLYTISFKNKNYLKIKDLMATYSLDIQSAFLFIGFNIRKKDAKDAFENGNFFYPDDDSFAIDTINKLQKLIDIVTLHEIKPDSAFKTIAFISPFIRFIESKKINWDQFYDRLEKNWSKLGKRYNTDQYMDMLLEIYNINCPYKVLVNEI